MKEVTCYESNDGTLYHDRFEAIKCDKLIEFKTYYENNKLSTIEADELISWLLDNISEVKPLMTVLSI